MRILATIILLCCPGFLWAAADTHYVSLDGENTPPYTNGWASAARIIQDAISASTNGDTVLVSNGVYKTGGITNWPAGGLLTNRVAITNAIIVRSLNNDPTNTTIKGEWASNGQTNGADAVRCVYMVQNASLSGFTITNGATITLTEMNPIEASGVGGGVCAVSAAATISNCIIANNSAYGNAAGSENPGGGGVYYATIYNCTLSGNSTRLWGGGARNCTIYDSLITSNSAVMGGGAYASTLSNCIVQYNYGSGGGGGVYAGTARHSTFRYNRTRGASLGKYYNCLFYGNEAGIYNCDLIESCTIVGDAAGPWAASRNITVLNSIIYSNGVENWTASAGCFIFFTNTCTTPTNAGWAAGNNTTNNPQFVAFGIGSGTTHVPGNYHLKATSPCVNRGLNQAWMTNGVDLDGRMRIRYGTVDMGAYEAIYGGSIYRFR